MGRAIKKLNRLLPIFSLISSALLCSVSNTGPLIMRLFWALPPSTHAAPRSEPECRLRVQPGQAAFVARGPSCFKSRHLLPPPPSPNCRRRRGGGNFAAHFLLSPSQRLRSFVVVCWCLEKRKRRVDAAKQGGGNWMRWKGFRGPRRIILICEISPKNIFIDVLWKFWSYL